MGGTRDGLALLIQTLRGDRSRPRYGAALGVSYSAIRKYEHGESIPTWPVIARIVADAGMDQRERQAFLDLCLQTASLRAA